MRVRPCLKWVSVILFVGLAYGPVMDLVVWMHTFKYVFWVAIAFRFLLLTLVAPALFLNGWMNLNLGWVLPQWLTLGASAVAVATLFAVGRRRLRDLVEAEPVRARRAFLAGSTVTALAVAGVVSESRHVLVRSMELPLKDLPPELKGLKMAVLSDLHRGPVVSKDYLARVVEMVNRQQPDLVLLPGDFVSKSSVYFDDIATLLGDLKPKIATVATLGNHDHWEGREVAHQALERAGAHLLHNRCLHLGLDRKLGGNAPPGLCLVGVDDLWAGEPDLAQALQGASSQVPRVLLSHNPDFAEEQAALDLGQRIDLQLSGHTHGGQVVIPGVGPVASGSNYGVKYLAGWAQGPAWPVFTTRGVGTSVLPVRVGAEPEIVVFTLQTA